MTSHNEEERKKKPKKNKKKKIIEIMFFLFALFLVNFISARVLDCSDEPVALWHFDEAIGTTATDSCYGVVGDIHGTNISRINGKYGKSIYYNGYDTYVDLTNKITQGFNELSIVAWVEINESNADYQTFVGREIPYGDWVWNFALAKDSVYMGYPEDSYFNIFDIDNGYQDVLGTYFTPYNLTDKNWHLLIGTFNGTEQNMSFYFDGNLVTSSQVGFSSIYGSPYYFFFGTSFNSAINNFAYFLNGSLDEVAIFNRSLTQEEIWDFYGNVPKNFSCYPQTNINQSLNVPSYPYVDLNVNYPIEYFTYINQTPVYTGNTTIEISEPTGDISNFDLIWDFSSNSYKLTVLFTAEGDYPFSIYSSCGVNNLTGTFLVRTPFYVTLNLFEGKNTSSFISNKYKNDFAYATAEIVSINYKYDTRIEPFINSFSLGSNPNQRKPVFHSQYLNGQSVLKLYESNKAYAFRLIDGQIYFPNTYSVPIVLKSYGTNIFIGVFNLTNQNEDYNIYLSEMDIHPYRFLINWAFIILIIGVIILSVFFLFIIPDHPSFSMIFATIFIVGLTLLRIILFFYKGW